MFLHIDLAKEWIGINGDIDIHVKKALQQHYKAQIWADIYGHLSFDTPTISFNGMSKNVNQAKPFSEVANHLLFSGDPDTMPTQYRKQLDELKREVHVDLLKRTKIALKTLESL